jgi:hypothetical protein
MPFFPGLTEEERQYGVSNKIVQQLILHIEFLSLRNADYIAQNKGRQVKDEMVSIFGRKRS